MGFAVQTSTASDAIRSALSIISDSSAVSQPAVFGTAVNGRDCVTSPTRAVTLKLGWVS